MNKMNLLPSKRSGRLFVITGPSGVGKGTIVSRLLSIYKKVWLSVSSTTRKPRAGEIHGEHYFFTAREDFNQLIASGGFLEWAEFAGNFYGTPVDAVQTKIKEGRTVLLEIELEGARQVKKSYENAFMIFIAPPDFNELEKRIRGRATDSEMSIKKRLERAQEELKAKEEFDAIVINNDLEKAVKDVALVMNLLQ